MAYLSIDQVAYFREFSEHEQSSILLELSGTDTTEVDCVLRSWQNRAEDISYRSGLLVA